MPILAFKQKKPFHRLNSFFGVQKTRGDFLPPALNLSAVADGVGFSGGHDVEHDPEEQHRQLHTGTWVTNARHLD